MLSLLFMFTGEARSELTRRPPLTLDPTQAVPHSHPLAPTSPGFSLTRGHSNSLLFRLDFFLSDASFSGAPRLSLQASPWILNPNMISIYVVSSLSTRTVPRILIPSQASHC